METIKIIPFPEKLSTFLALPDGIHKRALFEREYKHLPFAESNILYRDGNMYYSDVQMKIVQGRNGQYFLRQQNKHGFTFDGKKLRIWFKESINHLYANLPSMLTALKHEWASDGILIPFITKGALEKILQGKLTNPIDLIKYYLKACHLKCYSPGLLYKVLKDNTNLYGDKSVNKYNLMLYADILEVPNHYLLNPRIRVNDYGSDFGDLCTQAVILGRKVSWNWSSARIHKEHHRWTMEIMAEEMKHVEDELYYTPNDLSWPPQMELLNNKKRLFAEGMAMHHCIYTNYESTIKRGTYFAFHINYNGEQGTLGLQYVNNKYNWGQLRGPYNKSVSNEMDRFVKDWFNDLGTNRIETYVHYQNNYQEAFA